MKPRLWAVLALSTGLTVLAFGAAAQQQQQPQRQQAQRQRTAAGAAPAAQPQRAAAAPARQPARQAAAAAQPSLLDKLTSMLSRPPAPAPQPAADPNTPQALPVNWAASSRYAQASKGGGRAAPFITRNRPAIDSLSVPVLLPGEPDLLANMRLFPHGDFYTVSSNGPNGLSFVMSGHSKAYPLPPGLARSLRGGLKARIPADGILISETEAGRDAEFSRFGAAYAISLDCRLKQADPRCGDDAYLRGVISRLVTVNPAGRG
jgi:hypothetical protein